MSNSPDDVRRSERENKGIPPERFGDPFSGTPSGLEAPRYQSTPMTINKLSKQDRSKLGRQSWDKEDLEKASSKDEDGVSIKSVSSVKTNTSIASLLRRKKMELQIQFEEEKSRMEDEKEKRECEKVKLEAEDKRDERKIRILKMKQEFKLEEIKEELGIEDGGSQNRDLDVKSVSSGTKSNHSDENSFVTASIVQPPSVVNWLQTQPNVLQSSSPDVQQSSPVLQSSNVQQSSPVLQSSNVQQCSPVLQSSNVQQCSPVLQSSNVQQSSPVLQSSNGQQASVVPCSSDSSQFLATSQQLMVRRTVGRDLPYFSGNPNEWSAFIYRYRRSTSACGFSPDENLARLEHCLKGEAKEAVRFMLNNPDKVDKIISTLEKYFGDPTLQIKSMISKIERLSDIKEGKFEGIVELSRTVISIVDTAESINKMEYLSNPLLLEDIVKKLSFTQKMQWKEKVHEGKYQDTVKDLSSWIETQADIAFKLKQQSTSENKEFQQQRDRNPQRDNQNFFRDHRDNRNQGRVFNANEVKKDEVKVDAKKLCIYCEKGQHSIEDCRGFKVLQVDRKNEWVKKRNLCYCCLKPGHRLQACRKKKFCTVYGCKSAHHPLLHIDRSEPPKENETSMVVYENKKVLLSVIPVVLKNSSREVHTYALLDSGSTVTMLDEEVAKDLQADGEEDPLRVTWMNNKSELHNNSKRVSIGIKGTQGSQIFKLVNVRTVKNLQLPYHSNNSRELIKKWDHLKDLNIQNMKDAKVKMIIGNDNLNISVPLETRKGSKTAPIASRTELGWLIHGKISLFKNSSTDEDDQCYCCHEPLEDDLHKLVKNSFTTENFGVKVSNQNLKSKDDIKAEEVFNKVTRRVGEKWESGLLWKNPEVKLPESKSQALVRLRGIEKKIDKDKDFADQYNVQIQGYIDKGYARKLSKEETNQHTDKTWYLPHFAVSHPHKPGKVRVVFDAAAKINGTSLNDKLFTGPDNLNSLVGTLFKFREGRVGFTGDIKEMFHQIRMKKEDRGSQRFLWRGANRDKFPDVYEMQVLIFGCVSSPYVAGEVKNRNAFEFEKEFPDAVKAITQKHYVDDYLDSCESEEQAIDLINQVKEVHRRGGFEIGKWACNSKKVMKSICSPAECSTEKELNNSESSAQRVLGLKWDPVKDKFNFSLNFHRVNECIVNGIKNPTKREILKLVMSVFDPLGFLSCFTMKAKVLLQEVWKTGIGWDDEIPHDLRPKWQQWIEELKSITQVEIPRCHSPLVKQVKLIQLHIFCDASQKAFSSVGYFRFEYEDRIETSFVMSKTKVAPININSMSIPRLELQAAVLGSRMATTIQELHSFKIDVVHFWSDSSTVLGWIRATTKRFKQFVGHRIGEILETSNVQDWHWIPTDQNVADDATRDEKVCDLSKQSRWWHGPEFLLQDSSKWPVENHKVNTSTSNLEAVIQDEYTNVCEEKSVFDPTRHSSWLKLVRSTAWAFRFIQKCKKSSIHHGELVPEEIKKAEKFWYKKAQKESFPDDLDLIQKGKCLKNSNKLKKFSPYLDEDQIIRMKSRILNSPDIKEETRRPIILDPNHRVTFLLVQHFHKKNHHIGSESVVNEVKQKYWIFNLRSLVRSVLTSCQACKNRRAKPQVPEMGELPECRVTRQERPFMVTGLDYFGPIEVTVGRRHEKRYGALFTCLSTRAVHIELADSLTTDSAIMAIRRFMCIRGQPKQLYSDNGTNFKGADSEIKRAIKELDQDKLVNTFCNEGIEWKFIPPLSPHMGGAWERLVKSVKSVLMKTLKKVAPKEEVLRTSLNEAAYSVNSHPLTYVSSNQEDPESLTPNHFLIGPACIVHPMGKFKNEDIWSKRWRASQVLADHFWKRWVSEYLPTLGRRSKWNEECKPIQVGDTCLVVEDNLPRNEWQMGIVVQVNPGRDGRVRVVEVKMFDKKKNKMKVYTRPVAKLCVLTNSKESS